MGQTPYVLEEIDHTGGNGDHNDDRTDGTANINQLAQTKHDGQEGQNCKDRAACGTGNVEILVEGCAKARDHHHRRTKHQPQRQHRKYLSQLFSTVVVEHLQGIFKVPLMAHFK